MRKEKTKRRHAPPHSITILCYKRTQHCTLANNSQHCWMLHVASVCTPCCMMLDVAQSLKPVKVFSQQLPTFLLFRDRRSVAQQCWIRLHSSSNIVGATHAHRAWFTKTYWLYPSPDALQVSTLLGVVVSVCTPQPTRTQQLPTSLAQQCWELLRPFARSLNHLTEPLLTLKCITSCGTFIVVEGIAC